MDFSAVANLPEGLTIHRVSTPEQLEQWTPSLTTLLLSCINDDPPASSLGFRAPLSTAKATEFWSSLSPQLFGETPRTTLFVLARDATAIGTMQLVTHPKETHSHKVEVGKLLVSEKERSHGLGRKLMQVAEKFAKEELGKTMVMLDTATKSPARGFYVKLGYTEWGVCPQYAESADGHLHDTSFFYKFLGNKTPQN
ncbi:acetyltransferase [Fusarium beomiforme]|uniref:Acetyltransferase n=1 Tax=Fusarium beomiforme TaxID=44412 RepID=A0A9P5DS48_9HYPO|nr:acetyltransferase [Fusarium beomiforme]